MKAFLSERDRVNRGNKEAQWNHKYMKILEGPVTIIEQSNDLGAVEMNVGILMTTLHDIF